MRRARRRSAFTLLETLLAAALLSALMAAGVTLLFHIAEAWSAQTDRPAFERHADGLDTFLRRMFAESGYVTPAPADRVAEEGALLTLTPPPDLPWFAPVATASGPTLARLAFTPDRGLTLRWNTRRELALGLAEPHVATLSTRVVAATLMIRSKTSGEWTDVTPGNAASGGGSASDVSSIRILCLELRDGGRNTTLRIPLPRSS